jgi:D-glycero-alpha-D-manno-heptose-7-phosphate kinase
MIITRTPYRVSFFGGGTDYPAWFHEHGGAVLATTIDKYCYLSARYMPAFLGTRYRVMWSKIEAVDRREDIQHAGVRGCLEYLGVDTGFEINHAGDLPARAGLGSSSSFTVGMLNAMHALNHQPITKAQLAREAIAVEQEVLKETVGIQDQIQCAYGGLNLIRIRTDGTYGIYPLALTRDRTQELQAHLMLFFTGIQRHASEIATEQIKNAKYRINQLTRIMEMPQEGFEILNNGVPIERFGELLNEAWLLKRGMSPLVTNDTVDVAYAQAMAAGAIGGKLLGAGGGGFMLIFARPSDQQRVREAIAPMIEVAVSFEGGGAQVVHAS